MINLLIDYITKYKYILNIFILYKKYKIIKKFKQ